MKKEPISIFEFERLYNDPEENTIKNKIITEEDQEVHVSYPLDESTHKRFKFIVDCEFENALSFAGSPNERPSTLFKGCLFNTKRTNDNSALHIFSSIFQNTLSFENCSFNGHLYLDSIHIKDLKIINCEISNNLIIRHIDNCNCNVTGSAERAHSKIKVINFQSNENSSLLCQFYNIDEILFSNIKSNNILLKNGDYELIDIHNSSFKNFNLSPTKEKSLKITKIRAQYFTNTGNFSASNCIIKNLDFSYLNNSSGNISFHGIREIENLNLNSSTVGNFVLSDIDFSNIDLDIHRTNISELELSYIKWPKDYNILGSMNQNVLEAREVYRQFKHAYIKINNKVEALNFYYEEMKYHRLMTQQQPWYSTDRFVSKVDNVVSKFGKLIWKPILFMLGFHLLLTCLITIDTFSGLTFTFKNIEVWESISLYFYTLFPFHKVSGDYSNITLAIDSLMRLSSGFFIYHIIRASRKFGRI